MITAALRRLLRLPPPRCGSDAERCFVAMRDGVRLATWHVWPIDVERAPGTIVIRTPYGAGLRCSTTGLAARLLAESGFHVIVQDVRGRYASEGRFEPFVNERRDGGDTLRWVAAQSWASGPVGLFGVSYLAYTAWCALADAPEQVAALVSVIGSGDIYGSFYRGGALSLANTLEWGVGVGEREVVPRRRIDLPRGLVHRPLREADRVALRTVDWVRDWVDHPRRDAYWRAIAPELPARIPAVLGIAGAYDFFLECQLRDHAALEAAARERGGPPPRLLIGPWAHGLPARLADWRESLLGHALRASIAHFDEHLCGEAPAREAARVRFYLPGSERWREAESWPPPQATPRTLHLCSDGERGRLAESEPADGGEPLRFRHDPASPTPTLGGALFGWKGGVADQRPLEARPDLVVYESEPCARAWTLAGPVRLLLQVAVDAEDFDVTARLVDVAPNGRAENVCDGIQRARWRDLPEDATTPDLPAPGRPTRVTVELGSAARTLRSGHRLRLVVGASNFPRFDRNPGCALEPARARPDEFRSTETTLFHGAPQRASLLVHVLDADARGAGDARTRSAEARGPAEEEILPAGPA